LRHASVTTTEAFYVDLRCDDIGDELWQHGPEINTSVNSGPEDGHRTSDDNPQEETQTLGR